MSEKDIEKKPGKRGRGDKPLSKKEMCFVRAYLGNGGNMAGAVREAGYSQYGASSYGGKLMARPHIEAEIKKQMALNGPATVEGKPTEETVLGNLNRVREKAIAKDQLNVAAKCTELEGKTLGMFRDRVDMTADIRVQAISAVASAVYTSGEAQGGGEVC